MATSRDILNLETDARFVAQSAHRPGQPAYLPGQKLNPNNPADAAMIPVWKDIFKKVKAEADAGTLVTTYDHPEVAQNLADAGVADRAAAAHLDIAANAPDPATAQANIDAAKTAHYISKRKAHEAASKQPPTIDPQIVKDAAKEVATTPPPPPEAPAAEHIAHEHVRTGGAHHHAHGVHARAQLSRDAINQEAVARFRHTTHLAAPRDAATAEIWRLILQQVQREADAGTLVISVPMPLPQMPPPQMPSPQMPPWQGAPRMPLPYRPRPGAWQWGQWGQPGAPGAPVEERHHHHHHRRQHQRGKVRWWTCRPEARRCPTAHPRPTPRRTRRGRRPRDRPTPLRLPPTAALRQTARRRRESAAARSR